MTLLPPSLSPPTGKLCPQTHHYHITIKSLLVSHKLEYHHYIISMTSPSLPPSTIKLFPQAQHSYITIIAPPSPLPIVKLCHENTTMTSFPPLTPPTGKLRAQTQHRIRLSGELRRRNGRPGSA